MSRRARRSILYDGCYAHVFSRSIEKRYIFKNGKHFEKFYQLLQQAKKEYGFRIFHYCLMHTHFHLAIGIGDLERFSAGMKWLKWKYTKIYNDKRKRRGTVWQGRFNSLVIEDERYLKACGIYIEQNPVEAGIVRRALEWKYSSHGYHELGHKDDLVDSYEWGGTLPEVRGDFKTFFEKGPVIGSSIFDFYFREMNPV